MKHFQNKRNPVLPLEYHVPDSEAHVMPDGTLYIYGSFDDREDVFCSEKYHVVSTPDMEHWTIHDISFTGQQVPWYNDPDAPKYPGIDWSRPTPFIRKMLEAARENGDDMKEKFEQEGEKDKPALLFAPDCLECPMIAREWLFPTARKGPLPIRYSFPAAGLIRPYSSTMTDRLTITGGSSFPTA